MLITKTHARVLVGFLSLLLLTGLSLGALASEDVSASDAPQADQLSLESRRELAMYYSSEIPSDAFGGIYLEGDRLIVNVVESGLESSGLSSMYSSGSAVEVRVVRHSLQTLEQVKDFLTPYMGQYAIHTLDANEVTNEVDILLSQYEESIMLEIRALVEDAFPGADFLHFLDGSAVTIQYTVAYECPVPEAELAVLPLKPEMSIKIGSGY